jgi:hypothetical protein
MLEAKLATQTWWRWPLVPFAAILGSILGAAAFLLLQWVAMKVHGGFSEDGWMFKYILPVVQSAVFGYLYAMISCAVAPKGKVITGVVMVTVLFVLFIALLVFAWVRPPLQVGPAVQATISIIAAGIAAVVALLHARDEYH